MRRRYRVLLALVMILASLTGVSAVAAQTPDWDVPNGHFFTQTGNGQGSGYAITDDNGVRFWSEFKRLGGAQVVGYPVSRRFEWNGFTCQAMQRVVLQWRPDAEQVAFVNVFDLASEAKKDAWLQTVRQTPGPKQWQEANVPWDKIVKGRLAALDAFPAIKQAYMGVKGDPVTMNGLPTSDVVDMGNNYTLRAQRVVIQQWKEDVPWAKKGQVTFGLGGTIAKEAGLLPVPTAGDSELTYTSKDKHFQVSYPYNWTARNLTGADVAFEANYIDESGSRPMVMVQTGEALEGLKIEQVVQALNSEAYRKYLASSYSNYQFQQTQLVNYGDRKAAKIVFTATTANGFRGMGALYMFIEGKTEYLLTCVSHETSFAKHDPIFSWMASSFKIVQ